MVKSKNKADQRFINLHRVSQALISGATLGPNPSEEEENKNDATDNSQLQDL